MQYVQKEAAFSKDDFPNLSSLDFIAPKCGTLSHNFLTPPQDGEDIVCPECARKKMMEEMEAE